MKFYIGDVVKFRLGKAGIGHGIIVSDDSYVDTHLKNANRCYRARLMYLEELNGLSALYKIGGDYTFGEWELTGDD